MASADALLYGSIVGFAVVSWLVWKFLLSAPPRTGAASSGTSSAAAAASSASRAGRAGAPAPGTARTRRAAGASSSSPTSYSSKEADDDAFAFGQPRCPPHVVEPAGWGKKKYELSGCLVQGVVPFRSTPASGYEARLQSQLCASSAGGDAASDLIVANRRERARIFARMFAGQKGARPPNRGANIVLAIRHTDVSCAKLQKVLFLLGTYYNLFLLIDGSGAPQCTKDEEVREFVKRLRSELLNHSDAEEYRLSSDILPPHRIAFASTSKGRVAFVRQLHGTELVVDCDEDVITELERFGFRVIVYPQKSEGRVSALGNYLVP
ncbi:hypothetical protein ACHAXT_009783 [Thalassiosira profunda]